MYESVRLHLWRFCCLFLLGAGIEAVVETYAVVRSRIRLPRYVRALADGLFSLVLITGSAFALFFINGGDLRLYVAVGMSLGFYSCRVTLGCTIRKVLTSCLDSVLAFAGKMHRRMLLPAVRTLSAFFETIRSLAHHR